MKQGILEVFSDALIPISVSDTKKPDYPLLFVNEAFSELTGYDSSETIGRNCRFLQTPGENKLPRASIREALAEGRGVQTILRNRKKDGTEFLNLLILHPLFDGNGDLDCFVGSQFDISGPLRTERLAAHTNGLDEAFARVRDKVGFNIVRRLRFNINFLTLFQNSFS